MLVRNPIVIGISPNAEPDDVWNAFSLICSPWRWRHGPSSTRLTYMLQSYFPSGSVSLCVSGRSALYDLLTQLSVGVGDEVLIQAFTCMVVPNSIRYRNAVPVYVDIDEGLNMDPDDLERKITVRTKAVIVQHTFGNPASMDRICAIAKKHHLIVIEDLAHGLGQRYRGKLLGTIGDAAFLSFGRDKVISSVFGGAWVIKKKRMQKPTTAVVYKDAPYWWIFQQLFHPLAFFFIKPLYDVFGIGKAFLVLLQNLHMLSFPVSGCEKCGRKPVWFMYAYPNALAALAVHQFEKLDAFLKKRNKTVLYYQKALRNSSSYRMLSGYKTGRGYLRFPLLVDDPQEFIRHCRTKGIYVGIWYHAIIDPSGSDYRKAEYTQGSCPRAEWMSAHIVNLPTLIASSDAKRVVKEIRSL